MTDGLKLCAQWFKSNGYTYSFHLHQALVAMENGPDPDP